MKRCIKLLSFVCLFASCHVYGMKSLFDDSKEQTYTPGTQRSQLMPSATAALTPQAMEGLVIAQKAWQNRNVEGQMGESKESIKVNNHRDEPRFQLLYNILDTMPKELINLILDYAKEFRGECVHSIKLPAHTLCLTGLAMLSEQHMITAYATPHNVSPIKIWDIETGQTIRTFEASGGNYEYLTPLAKNTIAAVCTGFIVIITLPVEQKENEHSQLIPKKINPNSPLNFESLNRLANGRLVSLSRDSNKYSFWMDNYEIKVWDPDATENKYCLQTQTITDHEGDYLCLCPCNNGLVISGASCGPSKNAIKAWDLTTKACVRSNIISKNDCCRIDCLTQLANNCVAAAGEYFQHQGFAFITIWNPLTNECRTFHHKRTARYLRLTSIFDGHIAAGACDGTINIVDPQTGTCVKALRHDNPVQFLCASSKGWLISGSRNGDIEIWN